MAAIELTSTSSVLLLCLMLQSEPMIIFRCGLEFTKRSIMDDMETWRMKLKTAPNSFLKWLSSNLNRLLVCVYARTLQCFCNNSLVMDNNNCAPCKSKHCWIVRGILSLCDGVCSLSFGYPQLIETVEDGFILYGFVIKIVTMKKKRWKTTRELLSIVMPFLLSCHQQVLCSHSNHCMRYGSVSRYFKLAFVLCGVRCALCALRMSERTNKRRVHHKQHQQQQQK